MKLNHVLLSAALLLPNTSAMALDEAGAEALMRKSGCFKCHAVDKKKDGPSYKELAGKWKGKPDLMEKLTTHITTSPKVKIDGKEEDHEALKSKDPGDVKAVIDWIVSR